MTKLDDINYLRLLMKLLEDNIDTMINLRNEIIRLRWEIDPDSKRVKIKHNEDQSNREPDFVD